MTMQTGVDDPNSNGLWRRYVETREEGAFAAVVLAHLGLVHGTARRILPAHAHLADDVAQTVFCDLVQQASVLPADAHLCGWLHRHTCFTARKALRGELRRSRWETSAAHPMNIPEPAQDLLWLGVRPFLDEALLELDELDRQALVLRFLQGRPFKVLAETFDLSEDAARMRVGRALMRLRDTLERKGLTTTVDALGHSLNVHATVAAPLALAGAVTAAATKTLAASTVVSAGAWGKPILALAASIAILGGGVVWESRHRTEVRGLEEELWALRPLTNQVRQMEERNTALAAQVPTLDEVRDARRVMSEFAALTQRLQSAESALDDSTDEVLRLREALRLAKPIRGRPPVLEQETEVTIAPGQTLVFGGWELSPERWTFVLTTFGLEDGMVTMENSEMELEAAQVQDVLGYFVQPGEDAFQSEKAKPGADVLSLGHSQNVAGWLQGKPVGEKTYSPPRVLKQTPKMSVRNVPGEMHSGNGMAVRYDPAVSGDQTAITVKASISYPTDNSAAANSAGLPVDP